MKSIYLIKESENNYYKIGVSKNIKQRVKQLQTGSAGDIQILNSYKSEYAHKIEKALHRKYFQYNIKGEWFDLPDNIIESFKHDCIKYEEGFSIIYETSTLYNQNIH